MLKTLSGLGAPFQLEILDDILLCFFRQFSLIGELDFYGIEIYSKVLERPNLENCSSNFSSRLLSE